MIKAFHNIKNYGIKPRKRTIHGIQKPRFTETEYSQHNQSSFPMNSHARIRDSFQSDQPIIYFRPNFSTPIDHDKNISYRRQTQNEEASNYQESIGGIMNKLHEINRVGSPRSALSAYMSRHMSATDIYGSGRESKRLFIMEKLNNLERDVSDLAYRGDALNGKSRFIQQSFQAETPNARSTRTLYKVPGGFTRISGDVY